jgi:hypothetical protein
MFEFDNDQIATIATQTNGHNEAWLEIWNNVKNHLSSTAAEALDASPAGGLESRTQEYHAKTAQFSEQMTQRAGSVQKIGQTSEDANGAMTRTMGGSSF